MSKNPQDLNDKPNKVYKIKEKMTNLFELPKEIIMDLPNISILGKEEIYIENYKNIIEYEDSIIKVNTNCGIIRIQGKKLYFKEMNKYEIKIQGIIHNIEFVS